MERAPKVLLILQLSYPFWPVPQLQPFAVTSQSHREAQVPLGRPACSQLSCPRFFLTHERFRAQPQALQAPARSPTFTRPLTWTLCLQLPYGARPRCRSGWGRPSAAYTATRLGGPVRPRSSVPPVRERPISSPPVGRRRQRVAPVGDLHRRVRAGPLSLHHQVWLGVGPAGLPGWPKDSSGDPAGMCSLLG